MRRIMVDAGHGGRDPGAVDGGVKESMVSLHYATELAIAFEQLGFVVRMTRTGDEFISLGERVRLADAWPADIFISIHCNSSSNAAANGVWVIHDDDTGLKSGIALSHAVFRRMAAIPGIADDDPEIEVYPDRTGWVGNKELTVVSDTDMPAILVELGFLTNIMDREQLTATETVKKVAHAISVGVVDWLQETIMDPIEPVKEIEWPAPRVLYTEILPVSLDVDLKEMPKVEADGLRGSVMRFLQRNVTEDNSDWVISQMKPVLPMPWLSAWLLDYLVPDVLLDIIGRMLGRRTNGGT